ncbi:MAG TPA: alpha/beta hydrolase [Acidimicrobiia bacterium]|nr:alpha/beta hydrolase [Acidimicrobiia bacterium]
MTDPRAITVEHDGLHINALDWEGEGPVLLLLHPNGFCAGFFDPLAQELRGEYHPVGVDVRGHGGSDRPADLASCTFPNATGDALAVLDALGVDEVFALGHSMGGAVAIMLDEQRRGIVRRALLCEAIAFPPFGIPQGRGAPNPMADVARSRRAVWPDRETVRASYAARPPMNTLEPAALAAYVRYGFRDRPDGTVELACAPDVEARYFRAAGESDGAPRAFAHLPDFSGSVVIAAGDDSNLPGDVFAAQADAAGAPYLRLRGSHFFPQEDTARTAALVREHLRD